MHALAGYDRVCAYLSIGKETVLNALQAGISKAKIVKVHAFVKRYYLYYMNLQSVLSHASLPHLVIMENNVKEVVQESTKFIL